MSADDSPLVKVGIGASAGGLIAIQKLLSSLDRDNGFAYLVVMHLAPDKESNLVEILDRVSPIPVVIAEDGLAIEPDHVYVIPPHMNMYVTDDRLVIKRFSDETRPFLTINGLFNSLAEESKEKVIGVVLSGTGSDGSVGLRAIKESGGITFAQTQESAEYAEMPAHAIITGNVDYVLPPEEIAHAINRISKNYSKLAEEVVKRDSMEKIINLLMREYSVDFNKYKDSTFRRRLQRRVILGGYPDVNTYYEYLVNNPKELEQLYGDLLINVTQFFRDHEAFEVLKKEVWPALLMNRDSEPIRLWVVGCSTGEEVYSLGISLVEYLDENRDNTQVKLFGTDVSQDAVRNAREGIYTESIKENVSREYLNKYFTKVTGGYQIGKRIRGMCVFAEHDVLSDPPFSNLDMISCRNLLIYLTPETQDNIIQSFHYALKTDGILFLGKSETVGRQGELFKVLDPKYKIFIKKPVRSQANILQIPVFRAAPQQRGIPELMHRPETIGEKIRREVEDIVTDIYAPPGVVVDGDFDIVQFRGRTSDYLENPPGNPSLNIIKMAKTNLSLKIQIGLNKAKKTHQRVEVEGIELGGEDGEVIDVDIIPLHTRTENVNYYLVTFNKKHPIKVDGESVEDVSYKEEVSRLRQELNETKDFLQSYMEDVESTNEELASTNEELQSSYEELQSINEELETAKEELQASNEELTSMNEELQSRNTELNELYNDLNNLINSVNIPIIIVDNKLKIRRATPKAQEILNIRPIDVGRPITEINLNMDIPNFEELLYDSVEDLNTHEMEVQDKAEKWYSLRIKPYRTEDRRVNGAVLTFVDIESVKEAEIFSKRLDTLIDSTSDGVIIMGTDGKIHSWNHGAENLFNRKDKDALGVRLDSVVPRDDNPELWAMIENAKLGRNAKSSETQITVPAQGSKQLSINVYPLEYASGPVDEVVIVSKDINKEVQQKKKPKKL